MKIRNKSNSVFILPFVFFFFALSLASSPRVDEKGLVAWWKLDESKVKFVKDSVNGIHDEISGNFRHVPGSSGSAIKFDGFTTLITRKASHAPRSSDGLTIEAWVAVAAYPWNWCPIVSQRRDNEAGYAFEVGPRGEFALKLFAGGKWQECLSEAKIPLKEWVHIAGTYDETKGITIFLNGKEAGMHYLKDMNIASLSRPGSCSHWPVGQVPSDGRTTQAPDRASSFLGFPISDPPIHEGTDLTNWVNSLYGMTEKPIEELVLLARSWAQAPELKVTSGNIENIGYDLSQRAYILKCREENNLSELECKLMASTESPVVNVCLYIKGWGDWDAAVVMEGETLARGRDYRLGHVHTLEGSDLVVWVNRKYMQPVEITLVADSSLSQKQLLEQ